MNDHFRQSMAWLHTWAGLVAAWVLFFVFITGAAGYFNTEIDHWMRPELPMVSSQPVLSAEASVTLGLAHLRVAAVGADEWIINLPGGRSGRQVGILWREPAAPGERAGKLHRAMLAADGGVVGNEGVRATGGGNAFYRMHYLFRYLPRDAAIWLVGAATMLMLLALITGVIVHKKIFADFFTFRPAKGQRSWLDAHNVLGVLALPFFLMITYSGLLFFQNPLMPLGFYGIGEASVVKAVAPVMPAPLTVPAELHDPLPLVRMAEAQWGAERVGSVSIKHPGLADAVVMLRARQEDGDALVAGNPSLRFDGVSGALLDPPPFQASMSYARRVMLALHEGRFAGVALRWLYFASGLLGAAMIATGLVLWTVKRRQRRLKAGEPEGFGLRLVESLNIATVAGLCTAVAVYFWANRLLPVDMAGRADWEFHALFIAWGLLLAHALLRQRFASALRAWAEQLWLAAAAFGLLPVVNALTTDRHLGVTLPAGDWVLAGFDLTMLGLAGLFAAMAWQVGGKLRGGNPVPLSMAGAQA
ncbi:MAG: hypothetical protein BGO63_15555 [Candidatus Accumulibacter sp. 66-26]|nr:PepSY domain-containing protein [Accumulibacter sp.]OJW46943.1 MAG: hypothetical protein BGO63_15555 [Candidatus Accumulibacter sp. 66-26]